MADYEQNLYEVEQIPGNDDLIAGTFGLGATSLVEIVTPGEYRRGDILMRSDSGFVPATVSGLASAKEACVLSRNVSFEAGSVNAGCYFMGRFLMTRVRVGEAELHELSGAEQNSVIESLRLHKIFLV